MKTKYEIEQMKSEIQEKLSKVSMKACRAWDESNKTLYLQYDREYAKLVAQYNILLEVLQ